jgi:hypothetical protein
VILVKRQARTGVNVSIEILLKASTWRAEVLSDV